MNRFSLHFPLQASFLGTLFLGAALGSASGFGGSTAPVSPSAAATVPTPGEQGIAGAQRQIAADPKRAQAYNDLALAYIRRARETADPVYYRNAETALVTGLHLAPGDFQLEKTGVALLLGRGQFAQALAKARELHGKVPDDVTVYGYMAEADLALGNDGEAESSTQWMLNMRPNNVPGLLLAAKLRVHYGDGPGALELLNQAFGETPSIEPEELARIANEMAEVELGAGKTGAAAGALARAEALFPGYPATRVNLERLHAAQAREGIGAQGGAAAATLPQSVEPAAAVTPQITSQITPQITPQTSAPAIPLQETRDTGAMPTALLVPRPTGTARAIKKMQGQVTARPDDATAYAGLGAGFFQRARETGDVEDYQLAEQALNKSLDLVSTDLSATAPLETMAEVCMGEHRFADALNYAQRSLALGSGDLSAFAIVGDAYADMGEYEKASVAYSRLQPATGGAAPEARASYAQRTRTAYLKFISGDTGGAIREMETAVGEGMQAHLPGENLAWLYFELGEFHYGAGQVQAAADAYLTALTVYPGDYRALAGLGKVRASQGKYAQAVTLYQSAIAVVPFPLYVAELADIYAKTGNMAEAGKQYKLVEYIGLLGHINQVLHNRDLALFYADHDRNLPEALTLARKEFEVRSDIYTWDALAWALYKNGKFAEANEAMTHALRLGTKDPMLLFHAGMIAAKLGHGAEAERQLGAAIEINPHFSVLYATTAAEQLSALGKQATLAARGGEVRDAR